MQLAEESRGLWVRLAVLVAASGVIAVWDVGLGVLTAGVCLSLAAFMALYRREQKVLAYGAAVAGVVVTVTLASTADARADTCDVGVSEEDCAVIEDERDKHMQDYRENYGEHSMNCAVSGAMGAGMMRHPAGFVYGCGAGLWYASR